MSRLKVVLLVASVVDINMNINMLFMEQKGLNTTG